MECTTHSTLKWKFSINCEGRRQVTRTIERYTRNETRVSRTPCVAWYLGPNNQTTFEFDASAQFAHIHTTEQNMCCTRWSSRVLCFMNNMKTRKHHSSLTSSQHNHVYAKRLWVEWASQSYSRCPNWSAKLLLSLLFEDEKGTLVTGEGVH